MECGRKGNKDLGCTENEDSLIAIVLTANIRWSDKTAPPIVMKLGLASTDRLRESLIG